jgi:hypothetical protein
MAADDWVGKRFPEPPERLTRPYFDPDHVGRGYCMYCRDDHDSPGPVFMWRDNNTLLLKPGHMNCVLCGQRYFAELEDLELLCGFPPTMNNIYDFETIYARWKARYRSIDDPWQSSS